MSNSCGGAGLRAGLGDDLWGLGFLSGCRDVSRDLECGVAGLAVALGLEEAEVRMRFLNAATLAENALCVELTANSALSAFAGQLELVSTLVALTVRAKNTLDDVHFVAKLTLREIPSA